uniref:Uncharacterized protein n=1 Tax=Ralstonia solanacearum TaxID=305 RepID=A0A0S4TY73_RALSL|nr:protein of unknown function [Ralstonia solanacearum]
MAAAASMPAASDSPVRISWASVASVRLTCSVLPAACATDSRRLLASVADSGFRVPLVSSRHLMIRSPVYCGWAVPAAGTAWDASISAAPSSPAPVRRPRFDREKREVMRGGSIVTLAMLQVIHRPTRGGIGQRSTQTYVLRCPCLERHTVKLAHVPPCV